MVDFSPTASGTGVRTGAPAARDADDAHAAREALASGVALHLAADRARVRVTGQDARAFLHRMSTNDVNALPAGAGRLNVLLTDKGRIVDLVHHLDEGDRGVLLVGSAGRGEKIRAWLDRYLFTESVELASACNEGICVEVFGAGAARVLEPLFGAAPLGPWQFTQARDATLLRAFDGVDAHGQLSPTFVACGPSERLEPLFARGAFVLTDAQARAVRVHAGVPGDNELSEAFTPLDVGLHDAIHWAKGCYIGQEVIARLDTYRKQGKHLVTLTGPAAASAGSAPPAVGAAITKAGVALGNVTTSVEPLFVDGPAALAVVRIDAAVLADAAGLDVEVAGNAGWRLHAPRVLQLPHG